jgi:hypothetical protein
MNTGSLITNFGRSLRLCVYKLEVFDLSSNNSKPNKMLTIQPDAEHARDKVSNRAPEKEPLGSRAEKIKTITSSFIDVMGHVQGEKPVTFDSRLEKNIILDLNSRTS